MRNIQLKTEGLPATQTILTDVSHCSVHSRCYKLCCEILKDWRRFNQTIYTVRI